MCRALVKLSMLPAPSLTTCDWEGLHVHSQVLSQDRCAIQWMRLSATPLAHAPTNSPVHKHIAALAVCCCKLGAGLSGVHEGQLCTGHDVACDAVTPARCAHVSLPHRPGALHHLICRALCRRCFFTLRPGPAPRNVHQAAPACLQAYSSPVKATAHVHVSIDMPV